MASATTDRVIKDHSSFFSLADCFNLRMRRSVVHSDERDNISRTTRMVAPKTVSREDLVFHPCLCRSCRSGIDWYGIYSTVYTAIPIYTDIYFIYVLYVRSFLETLEWLTVGPIRATQFKSERPDVQTSEEPNGGIFFCGTLYEVLRIYCTVLRVYTVPVVLNPVLQYCTVYTVLYIPGILVYNAESIDS